jgi:hypothetical protein
MFSENDACQGDRVTITLNGEQYFVWTATNESRKLRKSPLPALTLREGSNILDIRYVGGGLANCSELERIFVIEVIIIHRIEFSF